MLVPCWKRPTASRMRSALAKDLTGYLAGTLPGFGSRVAGTALLPCGMERLLILAPLNRGRQFGMVFQVRLARGWRELRFCGCFASWSHQVLEQAARCCELRPGAVGHEAHIRTDSEQVRAQLCIAVKLCGGPGRQSDR